MAFVIVVVVVVFSLNQPQMLLTDMYKSFNVRTCECPSLDASDGMHCFMNTN